MQDWLIFLIVFGSLILLIIIISKLFKRKNPKKKGILFFEKSISDGRGEEGKWFYAVNKFGAKTKLFSSLEKLKEAIGIR